jgi:hypothetical protein
VPCDLHGPPRNPSTGATFENSPDERPDFIAHYRTVSNYLDMVKRGALSPAQRQTTFNVIFGLFSGLEAPQIQADLMKLPESAMDDLALAVIVQQLGTVN